MPQDVGESNLKLNKILMYYFYYDYMVPKWSQNNVQLIIHMYR